MNQNLHGDDARSLRRLFLAAAVMAAVAVLVALVLTQQACGVRQAERAIARESAAAYRDQLERSDAEHPTGKPRAAPPRPQPAEVAMPAADTALISAARTASWAGRLFTLIAVLAFLASFIPVVGPYISRRSALSAAAVGLGCFFVQYWVLRYGRFVANASFWIVFSTVLVAGAAAMWPVVLAFKRWVLKRDALRLAGEGDARASVALETAAHPELLGGEGKGRLTRQRLLARRELMAHVLKVESGAGVATGPCPPAAATVQGGIE